MNNNLTQLIVVTVTTLLLPVRFALTDATSGSTPSLRTLRQAAGTAPPY